MKVGRGGDTISLPIFMVDPGNTGRSLTAGPRSATILFMKSAGPGRANRRSIFIFVSAILIIYGTIGVAVHLRLLGTLLTALLGLFGIRSPSAGLVQLPWLDALRAHYDALPWLPWAAWLVGAGLLAWSASLRESTSHVEQGTLRMEPGAGKPPRWVVPLILLALLLVAGYTRMAELWPQSYGLTQFPYDDEGVYAGASQLFLQGIIPYRDYFFAHPPMAAISYAPAMAYHFTAWGSPTSFMMARYLAVGYSLVTLVLVFFIGVRLMGLWGGIIAGLLWAFDGRVVEINRKVMLDNPMVLLSSVGLLLYVWIRPRLAGRTSGSRGSTLLLLGLSGFFAALSALTKIAGISALIAIMADLVWLALENRRAQNEQQPPRLLYQLGSAVGGALVAAALVVGPFLVLAPSQFIRQVFFFQVLRPSDGIEDIPSRVANLSTCDGCGLLPLSNGFTLLFAGVGFVILSVWLWRHKWLGAWRVVVLWAFFSLLLFTYSRSFYAHYYIQLAAPLCLLGAGVTPLFRSPAGARWHGSLPAWLRFAPAVLALVVALPLIAQEWVGVTTRHEDRLFEIVSRYVNDAVPPGTPVLTTDEQFNFLAARPPSRNASGYLVDSYGHLIYLGLGLNTRSWGDLINATLRGARGDNVYVVMREPAAQADILDRASRVPLIVIHQEGYARLTQDTVKAIEAESKVAERQARYTIYRVVGAR